MTGQTLTTLPEILDTLLGKQLPLHTSFQQTAVAARLLFIACQDPFTINASPQLCLASPQSAGPALTAVSSVLQRSLCRPWLWRL